VAQGEGPEFKPQYRKKTKTRKKKQNVHEQTLVDCHPMVPPSSHLQNGNNNIHPTKEAW
jgi:hypothetical protein